MKNTYTTPIVEITKWTNSDVITTSGLELNQSVAPNVKGNMAGSTVSVPFTETFSSNND